MKTIDEIYREMLACFGEETGLLTVRVDWQGETFTGQLVV